MIHLTQIRSYWPRIISRLLLVYESQTMYRWRVIIVRLVVDRLHLAFKFLIVILMNHHIKE